VVAHEFQILAVGHQPRGQAKLFQVNIVTGAFVVEREAFACETYAVSPFVEAAPLDGRDGSRGTWCAVTFWRGAKGRPQRIRPQPVLDVGDNQLLVLIVTDVKN